MKLLDWILWIMFLISIVISLITTMVLFGISYSEILKPFATMLPLEVSLAATLFVWGLNSLYGSYVIEKKSTAKYSFLLFAFGGILLIFVVLGVY